MRQPAPKNLQLIGDELAILWQDAHEDYLHCELLRAESPSALNKGEHDIFGNKYGGQERKSYPGVRITGWEFTGNYGIRIDFSDSHSSGIFSWDLLRNLGSASVAQGNPPASHE